MTQGDLFSAATSGATFSPCGLYRYTLARTWGDGPVLVTCGVNPSTADATADDPTIRREIGFGKRLGFGSLIKVNLYGLRSTDPKGLFKVADPVGPGNDAAVLTAARGGMFLCCWGSYSKAPGMRLRAEAVCSMLSAAGVDLHCLRLNADGSPEHTLMLPYGLRPVPFMVKL